MLLSPLDYWSILIYILISLSIIPENSMIPMINKSMFFLLSHSPTISIPWFHSHDQSMIHGWHGLRPGAAGRSCGRSTCTQHPRPDHSMAMTQEPIDWRYLPYIRPIFQPRFQGISPQNMAKHMVLTYLHFRILKFPLTQGLDPCPLRARRDEGSQPHFRERDMSKFSMQSQHQKFWGNYH